MTPDDRKRFSPAGQATLSGTTGAQLALDGTEREPVSEAARIVEALEAGTDPRQLSFEVPAAGELAVPRETAAQRRKRKRVEERRKVRAQRAARRRELLETRSTRKRAELCQRRAARASKIKAARGLAQARRARIERALAELPPTLRWRLYWAAVGQLVDEQTGEVLERMELDASRARMIVASVVFLWQCSVPEGRGRVVYGIGPDYLRKAVLPANPQTGEAYSYGALMNSLHRGETPRGDRWRDGSTGYMPAAAELSVFSYHQPQRPDGRAPDSIPADQRGLDEITPDGRRLPGYAFTQFRFPPECCWPAGQAPDQDELEEHVEHARAELRATWADAERVEIAALEAELEARARAP